jgi:NO-binding membrane sensor protein with MHYT domain
MVHVNNFSYGALNPVLAYLVSCTGCFLGLRCATRARAGTGRSRVSWLLLATLAIATTGIWVMHFIAMLGFTIEGQSIRYSVPITILSMVVAVGVVGIGMFIVGFSRAGPAPLLLGGTIVGLGVASMHYIGMAAVRVQDNLTYDPVIVAASVVIAVIAGTAALWAALRLDTVWSTVVAALIMGVAVSGMHYTAMAALRVQISPDHYVSSSGTASAVAFLLPLIIGISSVGFILSAVISLSPTAAEMVAEAKLMQGIGMTSHYDPNVTVVPARRSHRAGRDDEPGGLFRDSGGGRRAELSDRARGRGRPRFPRQPRLPARRLTYREVIPSYGVRPGQRRCPVPPALRAAARCGCCAVILPTE